MMYLAGDFERVAPSKPTGDPSVAGVRDTGSGGFPEEVVKNVSDAAPAVGNLLPEDVGGSRPVSAINAGGWVVPSSPQFGFSESLRSSEFRIRTMAPSQAFF
jgi:hypothetical protein